MAGKLKTNLYFEKENEITNNKLIFGNNYDKSKSYGFISLYDIVINILLEQNKITKKENNGGTVTYLYNGLDIITKPIIIYSLQIEDTKITINLAIDNVERTDNGIKEEEYKRFKNGNFGDCLEKTFYINNEEKYKKHMGKEFSESYPYNFINIKKTTNEKFSKAVLNLKSLPGSLENKKALKEIEKYEFYIYDFKKIPVFSILSKDGDKESFDNLNISELFDNDYLLDLGTKSKTKLIKIESFELKEDKIDKSDIEKESDIKFIENYIKKNQIKELYKYDYPVSIEEKNQYNIYNYDRNDKNEKICVSNDETILLNNLFSKEALAHKLYFEKTPYDINNNKFSGCRFPKKSEYENGEIIEQLIVSIAKGKKYYYCKIIANTKLLINKIFNINKINNYTGSVEIAKIPWNLQHFVIGTGKQLIIDSEAEQIKNYQIFREYLNRYTVKDSTTKNKIDTKTVYSGAISRVGIENYFDIPSVNMAYVKVGLYDSTTNNIEKYNYITSGIEPYIKSISMTDNGVKKLSLTLYDKDFGSYNGTDGSDGKSLEMMIRNALAKERYSVSTSDEENLKNKAKQNTSAEKEENHLIFEGKTTTISQTNLKLQFGYSTANQSNWRGTTNKTIDRYWERVNNESISGEKEATVWNPTTNKYDSITYSTNYEEKGMVKSRPRQVLDAEGSTTIRTPEFDFMITDYKSNITTEGIEYNITAIETKQTDVNYRILQRYEDLVGTPSEVLYILMKFFNQDSSGKDVKDSPVRLYWGETDDIYEEIDEDYYKNKQEDIPNIANEQTENKKISISMGNSGALYNYTANNQRLSYKTISSILNEFCAACPKKPYEDFDAADATTYTDNETGETRTIENNVEGMRMPLVWDYQQVGNKTYIILHYRRPTKVKKIREYDWGPANTNLTSVMNINITNSNEFAVLSSIKTFENGKYKSYTKVKGTKIQGEKEVEIGDAPDEVSFVNRILDGGETKGYSNAFMNCLYDGDITIMGDPFFYFDGIMQPCSYPIFLNIKVPISQWELKHMFGNDEDGNERKDQLFFGYNSKELSRSHSYSGYYVIKEITHNISSEGTYTTRLKIMNYPGLAYNLEKDGVITK